MAWPVPDNPTLCGLFDALSLIVIVPVRWFSALGVKVTLIVQLALVATELPQVLLWAKSPLAAMLVIESAAFPVLLSVTLCGALVVFTAWAPKVRLVGERLTAGRFVVCWLEPLELPPPHATWSPRKASASRAAVSTVRRGRVATRLPASTLVTISIAATSQAIVRTPACGQGNGALCAGGPCGPLDGGVSEAARAATAVRAVVEMVRVDCLDVVPGVRVGGLKEQLA